MTLSLCPTGQTEGLTLTNPTALFFIVARETIATLTQDKQTLEAQVAQLTPAKEQLDSLWIVLAVVFTLGVLF